MSQPLNAQQLAEYRRRGFVLVPGFLDAEESSLVRAAAQGDAELRSSGRSNLDGDGNETRLMLWNHPPTGVFGAISRCARMVRSMDMLIGEESYHWHSKMTMKEPRVGGAWEWHQDYGYWYRQCLKPDLASCYIAVDPADRTNGCLQVLSGSHHYGRIEHGGVGGQTGADAERVAAMGEECELVHVEMAAGDAVFFHSNTLHRSDANRSEHPRWGYICCFNGRSNSPTGVRAEGGHPCYTPVEVLPDDAIKIAGRQDSAKSQ